MGSSEKWCSTGICFRSSTHLIYVSDISDDVSSNGILFVDDTKLHSLVERYKQNSKLV